MKNLRRKKTKQIQVYKLATYRKFHNCLQNNENFLTNNKKIHVKFDINFNPYSRNLNFRHNLLINFIIFQEI